MSLGRYDYFKFIAYVKEEERKGNTREQIALGLGMDIDTFYDRYSTAAYNKCVAEQYYVKKLADKGYSNEKIADILDISTNTVRIRAGMASKEEKNEK